MFWGRCFGMCCVWAPQNLSQNFWALLLGGQSKEAIPQNRQGHDFQGHKSSVNHLEIIAKTEPTSMKGRPEGVPETHGTNVPEKYQKCEQMGTQRGSFFRPETSSKRPFGHAWGKMMARGRPWCLRDGSGGTPRHENAPKSIETPCRKHTPGKRDAVRKRPGNTRR